jgi:hypothetical protein
MALSRCHINGEGTPEDGYDGKQANEEGQNPGAARRWQLRS